MKVTSGIKKGLSLYRILFILLIIVSFRIIIFNIILPDLFGSFFLPGTYKSIEEIAFIILLTILLNFIYEQKFKPLKVINNLLQQSEERYRNLVESSQDWIWEVDKDARYTHISSKVQDILGYSPQELIGRTPFDLMPVEEAERIRQIFNEIVITKSPIRRLENTNIHKNGKRIILETSGVPIVSSNGTLLGYRGMDRDITEQKLTENALRESEEMYRRLISNVPEAIIRTDLEGNILFINETILLFYKGLSSVNIIGSNILSLIVPEERESAKQDLQTMLQKRIDPVEHNILLKDGSVIICEVISEVLYDDNNHPYEFVFVVHDITKRKTAEKVIRQSSENFKGIFDNSPYGMIILDNSEFKIIEVNEAFLSLYEIEREFIIGKNTAVLFRKDFAKKIIEKYTSGKHIDNFEYIHVTNDGNEKYIILSSIAIEFNNKPAVLNIIKDISELKKAEEEIRTSERRLNILTDAAFEGIVFNKNGIITDANEQLANMLNIERKKLLGRSIYEFIAPQSLEFVMEKVNTNYREPYEYWAKKADGEIFPVEVCARFIDVKGDIIRISVVRDVTIRKKSEEQIMSLLQRMDDIIELIPDPTFIVDQDKKIVYWNKAMEELTGAGKEDVLGKGELIYGKSLYRKERPMLVDLLDKDEQKFNDYYKYLRKENGKLYGELDFTILPSGKSVCLWGVAAPLYDKNNIRFGSIEVIKDITQLKQNEIELNRYKEHLEELIKERTLELEKVNSLLQEEIVKQKESEKRVNQALIKEKELNELKSRFISVASHEFRTPLATMHSSTELLEIFWRTFDETKFFTQVEKIRKNINSLTEIMDDVLVVSRLDSGKVKFEPEETNIETFIAEIIEDAKIFLSSNHKIQLSIKIKKKKYLIDEKLLRMALMNLVVNAVKYSPDGGSIDLYILQKEDKLIIKISDEGIGIPEKDKEHIFEPFHRASNVGYIRGTGLGLSIVKKYVEIHGGNINYTSEVGKGTTFIISIPIV